MVLLGASGGMTPGYPRKTNTRVQAKCRAISGPLASQQGEREARAGQYDGVEVLLDWTEGDPRVRVGLVALEDVILDSTGGDRKETQPLL